MTIAIKWLCELGQKILVYVMQIFCIKYVLTYNQIDVTFMSPILNTKLT